MSFKALFDSLLSRWRTQPAEIAVNTAPYVIVIRLLLDTSAEGSVSPISASIERGYADTALRMVWTSAPMVDTVLDFTNGNSFAGRQPYIAMAITEKVADLVFELEQRGWKRTSESEELHKKTDQLMLKKITYQFERLEG